MFYNYQPKEEKVMPSKTDRVQMFCKQCNDFCYHYYHPRKGYVCLACKRKKRSSMLNSSLTDFGSVSHHRLLRRLSQLNNEVIA